MIEAPWNTLEIAKLAVGVLTPLSVALLAWFLNRRLKRLDLIQWSNQKLIEKRIAVYDSVAPQLNLLLCFFTWVGYWKEISPLNAIQAKRNLDKAFNIYRHLFEADVYEAYQSYIHMLFETFIGPGHDARLRTKIKGDDGNRQNDGSYEWKAEWNDHFSNRGAIPSKNEIRIAYGALMSALTRALGVQSNAA